AGAVVGTLVWLRGDGRARSDGRALALGCLALSVVGNIAHRLIALQVIDMTRLVARFVLGVGAGVVFPVVLAWIVHVLVVLQSSTPSTARRPARPTPNATAPAGPPRSAAASVVRTMTAPEQPVLRALDGGDPRARATRLAEAAERDGRTLTGGDIAAAVGVSSATGRRWLADWRAIRDADTPTAPSPEARSN
ncbi:MAG: hypothetical protein ACRCZP_11285, partial [Phycicoccus sp.]